MRRSPRLFLVPLFVLAMLFGSGVSSPASAGAAQITGFADENVRTWPGPAWAALKNTGVKQVRHLVRWDVVYRPGDLATLHEWVNTAEANGLQVMISFDHAGIWPAGVATYTTAVAKFRQEFPQIAEYTAWNEPNHHPSSAPNSNPADDPALAADYWVALNNACHVPLMPVCNVVAGDFLDGSNAVSLGNYIDAYKKRLSEYGVSPSTWAIHPYTAIATGNWNVIDSGFKPRTEGKPIWFSEVGAEVCDVNTGLVGGSYPAAEAAQNAEAGRLLSLIWSLGPRVARTYYYFLSASNPGQIACPTPGGEYKLDTALLDANGFPRPAFKTLFPAAAHLPAVSTGGTSGIERTKATISGSVDPRGYHSYYTFEYGTTTAYGSSIESQYVGFEPGAVGRSATIGNLQPGTTYHYRIRAWNSHGPAWGADQTFTTTTQASSSKIQIINGQAMVVTQGPDHRLMQYVAGPKEWGPYQIAGPGSAYSSPEIVTVSGTTQIVVRGPNNELVQYWPAEKEWESFKMTGPNTTYSDPIMQIINGQLMIIVQGPDHSLWQYTAGASGWSPYRIAGPGTTYSDPEIAMVSGVAEIVVRGPSDELVQYWPTEKEWASFKITGPGTTFSDPVMQVINGLTMIVVQGPNNTLWQYTAGANGWSPYRIAGPGTTYSNPEIAMVSGVAEIVVRGPNNELVQYWPAEKEWPSFPITGPNTMYSDSVMQVVNGQTMIVVQGANHDLMQYTAGANGWSPYRIAPNAVYP